MTMRMFLKGLAPAVVAAGLALPALAAKDRLTMGAVLEPPHLDPTAGAAAAIDEVVYANVFEGLTRIDRNGAVKPALAKSWTVSDDGLTYSFELHDGVTFHDGTSFEADDVVFSFERALAEDSANARAFVDVVLGKYRVTDRGARPLRMTLFSSPLERPALALLVRPGQLPRLLRPSLRLGSTALPLLLLRATTATASPCWG